MRRIALLFVAAIALALLSCDLNQPVIPKTGTVYGFALDAVTGDSLPEVLIYTSTEDAVTNSDEAGQYSLTLQAGEYYLYVSATGYAGNRDTVVVERDESTNHDLLLYSLTNGAARVYGDVFCNATDTAIVNVGIISKTVPSYIAITDDDGHFEFYLPPGDRAVTFIHSDYQTVTHDLILDLAEERFVRIWMDPWAEDTTTAE